MQKLTLIKRALYLNRMIAFQDTKMIKVITGIRRCGKSSLMKLMAQHLRESGVAPEQILEMNFESMSFPDMDVRGFYEYVKSRILSDKRMYLFFDEVQRISGWGNAVNSFRVDFNCDIYITGSNAYLLSSELSTYYKWANSGIDESSPAEVKADVEGHNMAKTAGKEEMGKC